MKPLYAVIALASLAEGILGVTLLATAHGTWDTVTGIALLTIGATVGGAVAWTWRHLP